MRKIDLPLEDIRGKGEVLKRSTYQILKNLNQS